MRAAVSGASTASESSTAAGDGFARQVRAICRTIMARVSGWLAARSARKVSGWIASRPCGVRASAGKSRRFFVTIGLARLERCGHDVPVVGVGQRHRAKVVLVSGDEDVGDGGVHQLSGAREPVRGEVGPVRCEVAEGLIEDLLRPARDDEVLDADANEHVSQGRGVQDVRVVDDGGDHAKPRSWVSADSSSATERRRAWSARMYSTSAVAGMRRCVPTLR